MQQSWGVRKIGKSLYLQKAELRQHTSWSHYFHMKIALVFWLHDTLMLPYVFMVPIIMLCDVNQGKYQNLES